MDAVVVIDKPLGLSSFDVVARVRRLCSERRVGHAGTLDPLATGVLVVCLGAATKAVPYLMDADKVYRATARLGIATDTDDADPQGRVLQQASAEALAALDADAVVAALRGQVGERSQRPPRFSALKHEGQRLYKRARAERNADVDAGELDAQLDAKTRTVRIDDITVEQVDLGGAQPSVTFTVRCGKGTYIRSIARDLGEALGVGAHLSALRRLRVGPFDESHAVAPTPELLAAPASRRFTLAEALAHLPHAEVASPLAQRLRQGQVSALAELRERFAPAAATTAPLTVFDPSGALVAIVDRGEGPWRIARGF